MFIYIYGGCCATLDTYIEKSSFDNSVDLLLNESSHNIKS